MSLFAYFYALLIIISLFIDSADDVFAMAIINLQMIFMAVFAYIGFTFVSALITVRARRPAYSGLIFAVAVVLCSSVAMRILALVGAFVVIMHGKISGNNSTVTLFDKDKFN